MYGEEISDEVKEDYFETNLKAAEIGFVESMRKVAGAYLNGFGVEKNFDAAIQEYSTAIRLNPAYADAYYNRAAIYYGQKKYVEALADVKKSMSLNLADNATLDLYGKILRIIG